MKCNGFAHLCGRRLDEITILATHNSHATFDKGYLKGAANHFLGVPRQLQDGVRGLNFDVYEVDGQLVLYHGFKELGSEPFADAAAEVKAFLDDNPHEVLLLWLQAEAPRKKIAAGFEKSGLVSYMHVPTKGEAWTTLATMIAQGKRLLVFSPGSGGPKWMLDTKSFIYGTNWGTKSKEDFTCDVSPKPFDHGLFSLDHTLTNPVAKPELADANDNPFLHDRVLKCGKIVGKTPNIISLDWYSKGDGIAEVHTLNAALSE